MAIFLPHVKQKLILLLLVLSKYSFWTVCAYVVKIHLNTETWLYKRLFLCVFFNSHRKPCVQSASSPGGDGTRGECKTSAEKVVLYTIINTHTLCIWYFMQSSVSCRAEFEASSNSVEVRLHLAPHYHYQNGALHPVTPDEDSITVTFDRRKTVGDLRLAIYQVTSLIYF